MGRSAFAKDKSLIGFNSKGFSNRILAFGVTMTMIMAMIMKMAMTMTMIIMDHLFAEG